MLENNILHRRHAHTIYSAVDRALQSCTFVLLFGALDLFGEDLEECVMSCMPLLHQLIKLVHDLPASLSTCKTNVTVHYSQICNFKTPNIPQIMLHTV